MCGDVVEDRAEGRVIRKHVRPVLPPDLHTDHLVQLHRDRAGVEVGVQPLVDTRCESRTFEVVGIDRRTDDGPALGQAVHRERIGPLRLHALRERIAVVDEEDVQRAEIEAREEIGNRGDILVGVEMRVDRCDRGQLRQRLIVHHARLP